jgi:RNA polymerase sigma-70 factor (ECF subfamily)
MPTWLDKKLNDFSSDHSLLKAFAAGDSSAFDRLYDRHKLGLLKFLLRQCQNRAIAEEIAHDTWLAVISSAGRYQATAKFTTWLYSIGHKRLIDHWRKQGNSNHLLLDEVSDLLVSSNISGEDYQRLQELLEQLEQLPAEQTEAVLLRIEGFSYDEIAEITQTKFETVKSRLRYANQNLRGITAEVKV